MRIKENMLLFNPGLNENAFGKVHHFIFFDNHIF